MRAATRVEFLLASNRLELARTPTSTNKQYDSTRSYRASFERKTQAIGDLQRRLAAARRQSLLIVFEGLDASGKDGVIRRLFSNCDPQSCRFVSIEAPTTIESRYDFLWRFNPYLPRRGEVGVFNRSHYGDVVIPRVRPQVLANPPVPPGKQLWDQRCRSIVDWEAHLARNGTRVVKIFLHISRDEQRRRLLKRLARPDKSWKAEFEDVCDHRLFSSYLRCYQECIERTRAQDAPWFIVPADDKPNARLMVADIVLHNLRALRPAYPPISKKRAAELRKMRAVLLGKVPAPKYCDVS
jgi:PPK2 family polyphosphate:nucleotide phosphotransferase